MQTILSQQLIIGQIKNIIWMEQQHLQQETLLEKTLHLIDQLTGKSDTLTVRLHYIAQTRHVNLSRTVNQLYKMGFKIQNCHIFYLDVKKKMFISVGVFPFPEKVHLNYQNFTQSVIHLRYRKISPDSPRAVPNQMNSTMQANKKNRERNITDVINFVKSWRQLFQQTDSKGKRLNTLQSAARAIGISKKTLDDYYYQLRLAQRYNFNFQVHKHDKIGVMRRFIKEKQQKQRQKGLINIEQKIQHISSVPMIKQKISQRDIFHGHINYENGYYHCSYKSQVGNPAHSPFSYSQFNFEGSKNESSIDNELFWITFASKQQNGRFDFFQ